VIVVTDCPECDRLAVSGGVCSHCGWEAVQPNHPTGGVPQAHTAIHGPPTGDPSVASSRRFTVEERAVAAGWLAEARRQVRDAVPASTDPSESPTSEGAKR
jgi:hypothetical protein